VLLAIDPGTRYAGWSVMRRDGKHTDLLGYGCLVLGCKDPLRDRVVRFYDFFVDLLDDYPITDLAIETPFMGRSVSTYGKLSYLRGVLYLLSGRYGLALHEVTPRDVKLSVAGTGSASKEDVSLVVHKYFVELEDGLRDDVTDALALGLCVLFGGAPPTVDRQDSFI